MVSRPRLDLDATFGSDREPGVTLVESSWTRKNGAAPWEAAQA